MTKSTLIEKALANKVRLLLASILVCLFVYFVFDAMGGSAAEPAAIMTPTTSPNQPESSSDQVSVEGIRYDQFPMCCKADWLHHNPFRFDGLTPDRESTEQAVVTTQATATEPEPSNYQTETLLPVGIIFQSSKGRVALYGDQVVREGHVTDDGKVIERIADDGITLGNRESEANSEAPYPTETESSQPN